VPRPEGRCRAVFPAASPPDRHAARLGLVGQGARQAGLADPWLSAEQHDAPAPAESGTEGGVQLPDLALAVDERYGRGGGLSRGLRPHGSGRLARGSKRQNPHRTVLLILIPGRKTRYIARVIRIACAAAPRDLNGLPQGCLPRSLGRSLGPSGLAPG